MTPEQYEHLTELFHAALNIAPNQRAAFLDQVSGGDAKLRRELESLLAANEQWAACSEKPVDDIAAGFCHAQRDDGAAGNSFSPNSRLDHYEIRSLLGKGGMGEVYLAEDLRLHRKVALKILPVGVASNQDRMRRFEQEAQAAAALNHPHIAHIYEIGESAGTHFIAIEHIDGDTLRAKIHRDKVPLEKLLKYLTQVAEGLTKAHAAGIVHRDLKPDNIMITGDDYAKILDFGLAKLIAPRTPTRANGEASREVTIFSTPNESLTGMVMGTSGYMSPEQAQGKVNEIDQRSDIFSFGCILFEAATRQKPFTDESAIQSLRKVIYEPAPLIKDLNPSAPPGLQRILRLCLAKDREARYQAIQDVARELNEVRQMLAAATEIKTSVPTSGTANMPGGYKTVQLTRATSSAEYVITEIKRHKKKVALILIALLISLAYGLYKFAAQRKSAISSPAIKMTRLTATGKVPTGSISPDGKLIVYVVEDAGYQSVWIRQVSTSSNVRIVPPSAAAYANFSFTHDGNNIYFNKKEPDGPESVYQMPSSGSAVQKIADDVAGRVMLSSDDKRLAFIRAGPNENENSLIVCNSDGGGERVIATRKGPDNFYVGGIAWPPDGQSITAVVGSQAQRLVEIPLDGNPERSIKIPNWFSVINVAWVQDGSGLIVAALGQSRSSPLQLWHLSYPNGEARRITNDFSNYTNLSLTADSSALVVSKRDSTSHIWLAPDGDATRAKQFTTGTNRQDGNPSINWTPDGRILYDSTASGSVHTWIMNADGSDQRQLTDGAYEDQGAHVSPDGRYIVFTSNRTGTYHVYRMDIDGHNLKQLTNGTGEAAPFFSPDGRWVVCSFGNSCSWKVPADGGELVQLANGWASGISRDGKLLAYVRRLGDGSLWNIMIMPFEGGPPLKTFTVTSNSRPNSRWTSDGRAIIYNLTRGGVLSAVTNLFIQSIEGGPSKQLTNFTSETFFSFDWSLDGKSLACGRGSTSSDLILISDFR